MVDVGDIGIFSTLVAMLEGSEVTGLYEMGKIHCVYQA